MAVVNSTPVETGHPDAIAGAFDAVLGCSRPRQDKADCEEDLQRTLHAGSHIRPCCGPLPCRLCIEDTFYPNDQIFAFAKKDGNKRMEKKLHLKNNASEIATLVADGWKQSTYPVSDSGNTYPTEAERRSLGYKWEPLVRRSATKFANSLSNPHLILHAIPRNKHVARAQRLAPNAGPLTGVILAPS